MMFFQFIIRAALCLAFAVQAVAVFGCSWCNQDGSLEVLSLLEKDARFDLKRSALLSGITGASPDVAKAVLCLQNPLTFQEPPVGNRFYTEYLLSYFPKSQVMIEQLLYTMCPDAARSLCYGLAYFITNAPWRYFVNNEEDLNLERVHISILSKQIFSVICSLRWHFVDPQTGMVKPSFDPMASKRRGIPSLLDVWKRTAHMDEYYMLVALNADLIIHQLYSALKHEQYGEAYKLHETLEPVVRFLTGSRYEQQYVQAERLGGELVKMLQQRVWLEREEEDSVVDFTQQETELKTRINKQERQSHAGDFLKSFINHYEANVTGKFTHEYHPMLLDETAHSFSLLEQEFEKNRLPLVGRLTLMGYEEQGITRYKTRYTDPLFSDEMSQKTSAGWSLKMFNRFGLLTGFLCKDAAALNARLGGALPITHIDAHQVEIFDGLGTLFQEHAFGDAYRPTLVAYHRVKACLLKKDMRGFFMECMRFWHTLYSKELKVSGRQHVVGTQDILFSIAYTKYLQKSKVPLLHFYAGPDITYPIETSLLHNKEATSHAQEFVKEFTTKLVPVDNKKTAYVFCSFVDGVGKSTMLGNVQNMMKHGTDVEKYGHVDNSSSQLATVFSYSDDVVIADLPAQVSHFTYKPDGYVYVDCGALCDGAEMTALNGYVDAHKRDLENSFARLLEQVRSSGNYDIAGCEALNPELSYAATVCLLKKEKTNHWISFTHNSDYYLFDAHNTGHIRKRVPLATAPSHGLKNCCPEQMIFSIGVRFPMNYEYFLADLMKQLQEKQVEQVVMVDFVSMYSRSSRENIRVNYIIQQLALLDKTFSLEHSFYQDFVHNAQLLSHLDDTAIQEKFTATLEQESMVRLALFDLLLEHGDTTIDGISLADLTQKIRGKMAQYDISIHCQARNLVVDKIEAEYNALVRGYGLSREYITIQQFHTADLLAWSNALVHLMTESVTPQYTHSLWNMFKKPACVRGDISTVWHADEKCTPAVLSTGYDVEVIGFLPAGCRDRQKLLPTLRKARARWHASLSNLLYTHRDNDELLMEERLPVIPLVALPDSAGNVCLVQPVLAKVSFDEEQELPSYAAYGPLGSPRKCEQWRVQGDNLYLHDWSKVAFSHGGIYAYGHELSCEPIETQGKRSAIVSNLYTQYARAVGADKVLVPEKLLSLLQREKSEVLAANQVMWLTKSTENGCMPDDVALPVLDEGSSMCRTKEAKVFAMSEGQKEGIRLYLRAVATLDMLIKDVGADFALRRRNKKDFMAHIVLTEQITVPWQFGLFCEGPLFDSYEDIAPLV